MRRFLLLIFSSSLAFFLFRNQVFADAVIPGYFSAKCRLGETEIICTYRTEEPFGPVTESNCVKYEENPSYRLLVSEGHSFGGRKKFCYTEPEKIKLIAKHLKLLLPLIAATLLFEVPVFWVMVSWDRRDVYKLITLNILTVTLFYLAVATSLIQGLIILLAVELSIVIFEALVLKFLIKEERFSKIILFSLTANFISAVLGSKLLSLLINN